TDPALEFNLFDKSGVHRGSDWETLTIVTAATASGANRSQATADVLPDLDSRVSGTIVVASQVDWYQLTLTQPGPLTAGGPAAPGSTLDPRVMLYRADGQLLIQSDDVAAGHSGASLVQYLQKGTYFLAVSSQAGEGGYRLTSEFVASPLPF